MEYEVLDDKLIFILPERVNESNAMTLQNEIKSIMDKNKGKTPEFEMKDLKYISSSGLRMLLTIQKQVGKKKIKMKNVIRGVYEVMEISGFTDLFHVQRPILPCNIEGRKLIASGINGDMYRLGKGVMVKVYRKDMTLEEVEQEMEMTKKAMACGVPTVISFAIVQCGEAYGIVFEEVNADTVASLIRNNPDQLTEIAQKYGRFVKELHQIEVFPGTLPNIKSRYQEWLSEAKKKLMPSKYEQMTDMIGRMADCNTFIHGNLDLNNVILINDEMTLMDMGSCGYGHPVFDLQAIYASLVAIEINNPGYCEKMMGLDAKTCRQFWKIFIKEYTGDSSGNMTENMVAHQEGGKTHMIKESRLNLLLEQYYILKEEILDMLSDSSS